MLNDGSALLTLSYLGAVQTLPNYNVMGLAKASLEANTRFLAASMGKDNIRVNAIQLGRSKLLLHLELKTLEKCLRNILQEHHLAEQLQLKKLAMQRLSYAQITQVGSQVKLLMLMLASIQLQCL